MKLSDYIRGLRKGKEAHRLEKEAMRDPFLADAMDGYSQTEGNHEKEIERLRRQIKTRSTRQQNHAAAWSVAASLLIGICIGSYFLFLKDSLPQETRIALETAPAPESAPAITLTPQTHKPETQSSPIPQAMLQELHDAQEEVVSAPLAEIADMDEAETVTYATAPSASAIALTENSRKAASKQTANVIQGKVVDKNGEPLIGASITLKGTHQGTVTDIEGNFALPTDSKKELSVNYIGYEPVVLQADTGQVMLIAMNEDNSTLDEIGVKDYGKNTLKRRIGRFFSTLRLSGAPQPVIGNKAFRKYLKEELARPADKACAEVEGKVTVVFEVDSNGRPVNVTIKKSLCPSADQEAVRLIEEGPDWTVGEGEVKVNIRF